MSEHVDNEKKTLTLDEEIENLSHEDLLEITQSSLRRLIASDPLLCDLPVDVTTEEVLAQIAVAQGQSITVIVTRHSESPLNVVVSCRNVTLSMVQRGCVLDTPEGNYCLGFEEGREEDVHFETATAKKQDED